jgi:hypothetical protein
MAPAEHQRQSCVAGIRIVVDLLTEREEPA